MSALQLCAVSHLDIGHDSDYSRSETSKWYLTNFSVFVCLYLLPLFHSNNQSQILINHWPFYHAWGYYAIYPTTRLLAAKFQASRPWCGQVRTSPGGSHCAFVAAIAVAQVSNDASVQNGNDPATSLRIEILDLDSDMVVRIHAGCIMMYLESLTPAKTALPRTSLMSKLTVCGKHDCYVHLESFRPECSKRGDPPARVIHLHHPLRAPR